MNSSSGMLSHLARTMQLGTRRRVRMAEGRTADWKKAVVTIDTEPKTSEFLVKGGKTSQASRKYKTSIEEFGFGQ